jgi:acetyl esterase/lipase
MNPATLFFLTIFFMGKLTAQDFSLNVWPDGAPEANNPPGKEHQWEDGGITRIENISEAELFVFLPEKAKNTGVAVIICPGGGYRLESIDHEGFQIASFLRGHGVAGIVLKYRLPYGNHKIPLTDAQQAIRLVRNKAKEWDIDPNKIGIAGSSSGGHLASTAGTKFDFGNPGATDELAKISCRPDFMLLLYPVISFNEAWGHMGSRKYLIGEGNDREMVEMYSNELHVTRQTPPAFFVLADDNTSVPPRNSIEFYLAMKREGIPAEMHIFSKGGHGFGMKKTGLPVSQWPNLFLDWLKSQKIITNP